MTKESTHRAQELKELGWTIEEVNRYAELWEYRQRWGAINLEREDRQFLRKAESVLPKIVKGKPSVKKPLNEKSYYRWLSFYLKAMDTAENALSIPSGERGVWPILIEEELRALDYFEPVLGLPDTLKAKALDTVREELVKRSETFSNNPNHYKFDFKAPLVALKEQEDTKWRHLREALDEEDQNYPILTEDSATKFRLLVRGELIPLIRDLLPSLAESEKPYPPDDWIQN